MNRVAGVGWCGVCEMLPPLLLERDDPSSRHRWLWGRSVSGNRQLRPGAITVNTHLDHNLPFSDYHL